LDSGIEVHSALTGPDISPQLLHGSSATDASSASYAAALPRPNRRFGHQRRDTKRLAIAAAATAAGRIGRRIPGELACDVTGR